MHARSQHIQIKIFRSNKLRTYVDMHVQIPYTEKLSRLYTKYTIHWKTFAVHQALAIMYVCTIHSK